MKLTTDFNMPLTQDEKQWQFIFQVIKHHRKLAKKSLKKNNTKDKVLETNEHFTWNENHFYYFQNFIYNKCNKTFIVKLSSIAGFSKL